MSPAELRKVGTWDVTPESGCQLRAPRPRLPADTMPTLTLPSLGPGCPPRRVGSVLGPGGCPRRAAGLLLSPGTYEGRRGEGGGRFPLRCRRKLQEVAASGLSLEDERRAGQRTFQMVRNPWAASTGLSRGKPGREGGPWTSPQDHVTSGEGRRRRPPCRRARGSAFHTQSPGRSRHAAPG